MVGALSAIADPTMTDNMPNYGSDQQGYDTSPAQSGDPYSQMLTMGALQQGALQPAPETPEVQNLSAISSALWGSPQQVSGALAQQRAARDQAAQIKLQAIDRASAILRAGGMDGASIPRGAFYSALLTGGGNPANALGSAGAASINALAAQREIERQQALQQANLAIARGDVPGALAQQQAQDFFKTMDLADKAGWAAARAQAQNVSANTRLDVARINSAARVSAAQISAGSRTGKYQLVGSAGDGSGDSVLLDTTSGSYVRGPAVIPKQTRGGIQDMPASPSPWAQKWEDK